MGTDGWRDQFDRAARRGLARFRKRVAPILVGLLCCVIVVGPALSVGGATVDERYPDDGPPTDCIDAPDAGAVGGPAGDPGEGGPATAAEAGSGGDPPDADGNGSPAVVGTVAPTEGDGSSYRVDFRVPEQRRRPFTVASVPGTTVVEAHGFDSAGPGRYAWDPRVEEPWIRVRTEVTDGGRGIRFPASGASTVAPVVEHGPDVSLRPAGEGTVGTRFLALGDVRHYRRTVGCQRLVLVVPGGVSGRLLGSPDRVLEVLAEAARRLDVGHAYRTVRTFVLPGQPGGRFAGQARGNEAVVHAGAEPDAAWNVWIHEYVHTRQGRLDGEGFRWFREASASYLAMRVALEAGLSAPRQYDAYLAKGARPAPRPLLGTPDTKRSRRRGAAALSRLEGVLLEHDRTVGDLLAWVNARERRGAGSPDQRRVERRVENWTGSAAAADRFRVDVALTHDVDPEYASGPLWLPSPVRRFLAGLGHPVARAAAGVVLVVSVLAYYRDVRRTDRSA